MYSLEERDAERNMSEKGTLLVGLDLCNDFTQISCFSNITYEPESICLSEDKNKYLIPTVLGINIRSKEWTFGEDAQEIAKTGNCTLIDNLVNKAINQEEVSILDVNFTPELLLEKFLKKVLMLLKREYPNDSILKLVITIEKSEILLIKTIYHALGKLGLYKDRVSVQSHKQSYFYYVLSQKKELWMNDVGLFDFSEEGLSYYQMGINRKTAPMIVSIHEKNFTANLSYDMIRDNVGKQQTANLFDTVSKRALYKQVVSTVYVTGKGFAGDWCEKVLKNLCIGRRVFLGQNLYTKGACYAAREYSDSKKLDGFLFLGEEMIQSDVMLRVYFDAKLEDIMLAKTGTPWYEASKTIRMIPDNENELEITVQNLIKRTKVRHLITLDGLRSTPNKTVILKVKVRFLDTSTCVIKVKDCGFGEFFPSSNRIWEKTFTI